MVHPAFYPSDGAERRNVSWGEGGHSVKLTTHPERLVDHLISYSLVTRDYFPAAEGRLSSDKQEMSALLMIPSFRSQKKYVWRKASIQLSVGKICSVISKQPTEQFLLLHNFFGTGYVLTAMPLWQLLLHQCAACNLHCSKRREESNHHGRVNSKMFPSMHSNTFAFCWWHDSGHT
jgi:hypothetical protein